MLPREKGQFLENDPVEPKVNCKVAQRKPPKGGLLLPLTHLSQNYDSSLGPQMWDHVEWYKKLGSTFLGHAQCFFQILVESSKWIYQELPKSIKASYWKRRKNVCSCKFSNQDPCLHGSISNPNWVAKALGPPSYQVLSLDRLRDEGSVISCGFLLDGMLVRRKSPKLSSSICLLFKFEDRPESWACMRM